MLDIFEERDDFKMINHLLILAKANNLHKYTKETNT